MHPINIEDLISASQDFGFNDALRHYFIRVTDNETEPTHYKTLYAALNHCFEHIEGAAVTANINDYNLAKHFSKPDDIIEFQLAYDDGPQFTLKFQAIRFDG